MGLACGTHTRYEKFLQFLSGRIQGNIPHTVLGTYVVLIWAPQQKCRHLEEGGYYIYHLFVLTLIILFILP
jgi:hypothetical protein